MKSKLILAALLLAAASSASATVTLQFNTAEGSLTNFATSAGAGGSSMVWGIIIDQAGNGFSFNSANTVYAPTGLSYTASTLQSMSLLVNGVAAGATDDVLFLAPNLMNIIGAAGFDGAPQGTNRVTSIASVPWGLTTQIGAGDAFAIVWFDKTALGGAVTDNTKFGAVTNPGLLIPADSATTSFAALFTGPDNLKTQNFTIGVPEPSSMLLGLLGALGLLRRRR